MRKKVRTMNWWISRAILVVVGFVMLLILQKLLMPKFLLDDETQYVMPGTTERYYTGFQSLQLKLYMMRQHYNGMHPLIHGANNFMQVCVFAWVIFTIQIVLLIRKNHNNRIDLEELEAMYRKPIEQIVYSNEEISSIKIADIMHVPEKYLGVDVYPLWFKLMQKIHDAHHSYEHGRNRSNIQNLTYALGVKDFAVETLTNGLILDKYKTLRYLRQLEIDLPTSTVARLLNDQNSELRKMARQYYMTLDTENAYSVLNPGYFDKHYTLWDAIGLHNTITTNHKRGHALPPFRNYITGTHDMTLKRYLIEEAGFWVGEDDMEYMKMYLKDDDIHIREAYYHCVAHARYAAAEPDLIVNYWKESVDMKCEIVDAMMACNSGKMASFFKEAYQQAVARKLQRKLLSALYSYDEESKRYFVELHMSANTEEDIIQFQHVMQKFRLQDEWNANKKQQ